MADEKMIGDEGWIRDEEGRGAGVKLGNREHISEPVGTANCFVARYVHQVYHPQRRKRNPSCLHLVN